MTSPDAPKTRLLARGVAEGMLVAILLVWHFAAQTMPEFVLPGPLPVALRIVELFTDPVYLEHVVASALRVVLAVTLATALGTALAFLPRSLPVSTEIVHGRILPLLSAFPSVGWAILAVIWFGPSNGTIVFVMTMILTPFCLVNVSEGLRELDAETLEMAKSFTRRRWPVFFKITLPLLTPYVVAALRIAYGIGWKIALVAELFGAESGLGFLLQQAQGLADAVTVFGTCIAIVLIFWLGEKLVIAPLARRFDRRREGA